MAVKILLADDHPFFRRGIRAICESSGYEQIDEVDSCADVLTNLRQEKYTHLVLDLLLADGSSQEIIEEIRRRYPALNVLMFSSQPSALYAAPFKEQYGIPYISKAEPDRQAIPRLLSFLGGKLSGATPGVQDTPNPFEALTTKELNNLHYLLLGWSPEKIAQQLNVSTSTVRTHTMSILEKTKTSNLIELKQLAQLYKVD